MRSRLRLALVVVAATATAGLVVVPPILASAQSTTGAAEPEYAPVCPLVPGHYRCLSVVRRDTVRADAKKPSGLGATDIRSAYRLPTSTNRAGITVAIVDAFDAPSAEADMAVYRKFYHLPACTTANGCFRKVNQAGKPTPLPKKDADWAVETSLDLDMVSASCPRCHLLFVEASDDADGLDKSVVKAVQLGADVISLSWGAPENQVPSRESQYNHPGVRFVVASGDDGYGDVGYPAASHFVTAVGGTTLAKASNARGWTERAWADASSGCSKRYPAPTSQPKSLTGCAKRATADVAAAAERLDERLATLTVGSRTAQARHTSLRAAIDWSYDLADKRDQRVFRRLSVFAGGFDLDGATAVCADDTLAPADVLESVGTLVEQSLLVRVSPSGPGGAQRFRHLQSLRLYGWSGSPTRTSGSRPRSDCSPGWPAWPRTYSSGSPRATASRSSSRSGRISTTPSSGRSPARTTGTWCSPPRTPPAGAAAGTPRNAASC